MKCNVIWAGRGPRENVNVNWAEVNVKFIYPKYEPVTAMRGRPGHHGEMALPQMIVSDEKRSGL